MNRNCGITVCLSPTNQALSPQKVETRYIN